MTTHDNQAASQEGAGAPRVDRERLDALVADGWLRSQRHPDADLWIFNYTERTQYENHWTPETLMCRGLILDADGTVVARPFPKFFNWGTPQAADLPLHEPFTVSEKYDGSLGILYYVGGEARIASRGSFTSEQARAGTAMLRGYEFEHASGQTPLFEIVYPSNRIVVDYGERRELVLLAVIDNATGRESAMGWSGPTAERGSFTDPSHLTFLAGTDRPNAEGYVVTFASGARVKIKHAEYVRLHRIVTGVNARSVWEALRNGDDLDALLEGVPDEIHAWIDATRADLERAYDDANAAARAIFDARPAGADRRALAAYFQSTGGNTAVLFRMLDDKGYADLLWKAVKPEAYTPTTVDQDDERSVA